MTNIDIDYENPWVFEGRTFLSEDINDMYGFVYRITNIQSGKQYIGRKYFWQFRTPRGKKRKVKSESDWKKYYGSSKELLEQIKIKEKNNYKRQILSLHTTKGDVNYEEVKQLFLNNVLEDSSYYNDNINGKWYKKPEHIREGRNYGK